MSGEEQVPILELMRQCWLHGIDVERGYLGEQATEPIGQGAPPEAWAAWYTHHGAQLLAAHYHHSPGDAAAQEEYAEVLERIDRTVRVMIKVLIEAGAEMDPPTRTGDNTMAHTMMTDIEKALDAALIGYSILVHTDDVQAAAHAARSINQLAQARYWLIKGNMEAQA